MKRILFASILSLAAASTALAQVSVKDPWVRATVPAQKATGAFMELSAAQGARLVEARSPVAGVVEIHEMAMVENVMKMRAIPGLDLPPGKAVELKPGGYHVMLMDLKGQIKDGDTVPITLVVEGRDKKRSTIELKAAARPLATAPGSAAAEKQHKH
jgi:copper(I)-binding protein